MVRGFKSDSLAVVGWSITLTIALGLTGSAHAQAVAKLDFNRDVRPILSGSCLKCHGIDDKSRKSGLRLDLREAALAPADSGKPAIVPGKAEASELVKRVLTEDEDDLMPPPSMKRPLTEAQKQILKRWVAEGAEYAPHWAYVKPIRPAIPAVKQKDWPRNAIDAFVLAKLEAEGFSPAPEANKYTLARRVHLDLIGLPPTPEEADAFVKDESPDSYEKMVDRLLASPQYGERWARKWLDLARYSDTNGYEKDKPRSIWPYRDWVIEAINQDMPFDQFTVEQLAGDMLPKATLSQKVATGFHRNTMINEEGGIDPLEYRFHSMVDRVGTTGTTWLGLTVMCAQCHTHKYDPIRHEEYFGFMAALDNADEPVLELATPEILAKRVEANSRADEMMKGLAEKFPVGKGAWLVAGGTLTAESGAKAERQEDGSWLIAGAVPETELYTLAFETEANSGAVDRIKLETLMQGKAGPGRTKQGNFVLTEIVVEVAERGAAPAGTKTRVKLARAEADFSQAGFDVAGAIDGNAKTGWGIAGEAMKNRAATFYFDKPVNFAKGATWTVRLEQQYGNKHAIARPRVSVGIVAGSVAKADDSLEARRAAAATAFAKWEKERKLSAAGWSALRPTKLKSNAPTLTLLEDRSVLVSGDITKVDTYDLSFTSEQGGITAIRIEAMTDPSLPNNGPGKVHYEGPVGDFFLSEIGLSVDGVPAKFVSATHSFAAGKNGADKSIDGDPQSGWSINGGQGKAQHAVFVLEKPTVRANELNLRMLFEKYYAADIGRFRIWVSRDPAAGKSAPLPPDVENALTTSKRTEEQGAELFNYWLSIAPELAGARKAVEAVRNSVPKPPTTLVMKEREAGHARPTFLRNRGEFTEPKDLVKAGVPAFLSSSGGAVGGEKAGGAKPQAAGGMDRLTFARWLISGDNPLTARVIANRQWAAFFGRGIVRTTEDFGFQGELPSNQDLLDWLAEELVRPAEKGTAWSMKRLHRLMVTSASYRQTSRVTPALLAKDPTNMLISRGPRVRVEAETVRDSMLKSAGLLSTKLGGPSVFPPQPQSITTEGTYGKLNWVASTGEDRYRRSLYTFSKRTAPFALYGTFDAPTGDACVARREVSNTPLQALSLMNDEVFVEVAQAMGKRLAAEKGTDAEKVAGLFRRMLTRPAEAEEVAMLVEFASQQRTRLKERAAEAKKVAGEGSTDGDAVERALWVVVARAMMNLDEAVTKN